MNIINPITSDKFKSSKKADTWRSLLDRYMRAESVLYADTPVDFPQCTLNLTYFLWRTPSGGLCGGVAKMISRPFKNSSFPYNTTLVEGIYHQWLTDFLLYGFQIQTRSKYGLISTEYGESTTSDLYIWLSFKLIFKS